MLNQSKAHPLFFHVFLFVCVSLCLGAKGYAAPVAQPAVVTPTADAADPQGLQTHKDKRVAQIIPGAGQPAGLAKGKITGLTSQLNLTLAFNQVGISFIGSLGYRWQMYDSPSRLLKSNYFSINAFTQLTPAFIDVGALVAFQPLSIFTIRAAYNLRAQFPAFLGGAVFESVDQARALFASATTGFEGDFTLLEYIDTVQKDNNGERPLALAHVVSVDSTLRFGLGGFVLLANFRYSYWLTETGKNDRYKVYYNWDMLFATGSEHFIRFNAATGYRYKQFYFLLTVDYAKAFVADIQNLKAGPAFRWNIAPSWGAFKNPNFFAGVSWHILHLWRSRSPIPLLALRLGGEF